MCAGANELLIKSIVSRLHITYKTTHLDKKKLIYLIYAKYPVRSRISEIKGQNSEKARNV